MPAVYTPRRTRRLLGLPINPVLDYGAVGNGVADDTAAIQNAINATPDGGVLELPTGTYKTTAPLVIDHAMTFQGQGIHALYGSWAQSTNVCNLPMVSPFLVGTVIAPSTAGQNAFNLSALGRGVNLSKFGVVFDSAIRWSNTGHGISCQSANFSGKPDQGLFGAHLEKIMIYGHDGDHYSFDLVNVAYVLGHHLHSFGGGGLRLDTNSAGPVPNDGNSEFHGLFAMLVCPGTAHGVHLKATAGITNLIKFSRLQASIIDIHSDTSLSPRPASAPSYSTQQPFKAEASVQYIDLGMVDFEAQGSTTTTLPRAWYHVTPGASLIDFTIAGGANGLGQADGTLRGFSHTATDKAGVRNDGAVESYDFNANALPLGFVDRVTGQQGPALVRAGQTGGGAATGLVARTRPMRPSPKLNEMSLIPAPDNTFVQAIRDSTTGGANWSDVDAAPTIAAPSDLGTLRFFVTVDGQGTTNTPLGTLTNSAGGGNFSAAGAARGVYDTGYAGQAITTPNGKKSLYFDGATTAYTSALTANETAFTDFYILYLWNISAADRPIVSNDGAGIEVYCLGPSGNPGGQLRLKKRGGATVGPTSYPETGWLVTQQIIMVIASYDGATFASQGNDTPFGSPTGALTFGAGNVSISSAGAPMWMNLFMAGRFETALTGTQKKSLSKWGRAWGNLD